MDNLILDSRNNMYCYLVSDAERELAEEDYQREFSETNLMNSKTVYNRKESRIAGILGEMVFKTLYPEAVKVIQDITYDFDYKNLKIDVKCKIRKVAPTYNFEASFFVYQSTGKFNADTYYFMSTTRDYQKVWICGWGSKDHILNHENMELWKAGTTDTNNGMSFKQDTICLKYKYLNKVSF
jgi:hypothetical protein